MPEIPNTIIIPQKEKKKKKKKRPINKMKSSLESIVLGFLLISIGFMLTGYSEGINDELNMYRRLSFTDSVGYQPHDGDVKLIGSPSPHSIISHPESEYNLVYKKVIKEELKDREWVPIQVEQTWTDFKMGNALILPDDADLYLNLDEITIQEYSEYREDEEVKIRETVYGLPATEKLIIMGDVENGIIDGGRFFLISNYTSNDLAKELGEDTSYWWWLLKLSAWFILTLGYTSLFIPIFLFLDMFPNFGWMVNMFIVAIALVLSLLFITILTFAIIFWWSIIILVLLILYILFRIRKKRRIKPLNLVP